MLGLLIDGTAEQASHESSVDVRESVEDEHGQEVHDELSCWLGEKVLELVLVFGTGPLGYQALPSEPRRRSRGRG
ncbi:MAG: hypothetical protein IPL07_20790 [Acidimicrobiaceae bacterium]|nr:hypothetical protein [Acidimicrobiaceae bacterium]